MNLCPEKEELSAFVDGEVSENRLEEIDGHLKTCEACSKTVNSFLTLRTYSAFKTEDFTFDEEKSFENLKVKMRFTQFKNETKSQSSYFSAGIAVAAAVILAFIPLYSTRKDNSIIRTHFSSQNFAFQTGIIIPNDVTELLYPEVVSMGNFYPVGEKPYTAHNHHRGYRRNFNGMKPPFPGNVVFVSPNRPFPEASKINVELLRDTGIIQVDKPEKINIQK
ncbi:MAG: zf-HC2 domain-containing protein [Spirochaetaceae bacterium]|nr:zf-HC2 domain-containing protein [Spirochaetaceae bacterium]